MFTNNHLISLIVLFSHSFHHYPHESSVSLGSERRGCFEPPSEDKQPTKDIDCQDIVPTEKQNCVANIEKMKSDSQLDHPDSTNLNR